MVDLIQLHEADDVLSSVEAAKLVKREPRTVLRWMKHGLQREGRMLRYFKIGNRYYTRAAWLDEFVRHLPGTQFNARV